MRYGIAMIRHKLRGIRRISQVKRYHSEALPSCEDGAPEIVVSLTSYGSRLDEVHLAIRSIMDQSVRPNRIVLYLDRPDNETKLNSNLEKLQHFGLEIRFGVDNLKAHNKFQYARKEFPDAVIITIDDDVVYPSDAIGSLMRCHHRFPKCVVARRAHRIKANAQNEILPYKDWEGEWREKDPRPRNSLLATGVGAVLYPPRCFSDIVADSELIRELALQNDDLWLKAIEILEGIEVVSVNTDTPHPFIIAGTQHDTLNSSNVEQGENDVIFKNLMERFELAPTDFID